MMVFFLAEHQGNITRLLYETENLWNGDTGLPDLLWSNIKNDKQKKAVSWKFPFFNLLFFQKRKRRGYKWVTEKRFQLALNLCFSLMRPLDITLSYLLDTFSDLCKTDCVTRWVVFTLQMLSGQDKVKVGTVTALYSPIHQNHHCVRKCHYISLPLLFKEDHARTHTVKPFKVMFLQAAWGQVSSIINQLPGWNCIVYYCWTHHSSALKASDPWRVPVCVTVMDIVITMPSLSLYLSFCSTACCTCTFNIFLKTSFVSQM